MDRPLARHSAPSLQASCVPRIRTGLSRKGRGGMAKIVRAKIDEAGAGPKVAPARAEGRPGQVRGRVISGHHVPRAPQTQGTYLPTLTAAASIHAPMFFARRSQ
jgi:hypothetical protein